MIVSNRMVSSIVFRPRQSRPSGGGPSDEGGGRIACDRNEEEECDLVRRSLGEGGSTCGHEPTNGAIRPKEGRGWCGGMEETWSWHVDEPDRERER
jgi:hypothetical protein